MMEFNFKYTLYLLIVVALFVFYRILRNEYGLNSMINSNRLSNQVALSWHQLSSHPMGGSLEGNCVVHKGNVWVLSGYDCMHRFKVGRSNDSSTNVYLYNYETNRWLPGPRLPSTIHHTFSSAFSVGHRIITIGGLQQSLVDVSYKHTAAHSVLLELDTRQIQIPYENSVTKELRWRLAIIPESLRALVEKLKGSGMTSCTQLPTSDNKYYCYMDSAKDFIKDIPRFISIKFKSDRDALNTPFNESVIEDIEELPVIHNLRHSHSSLIVDLFRNQIIILAARDSKTRAPNRDCYSFSISKNIWTRLDEIRLPYSIEPYESRAFIQHFYHVNDEFSLSWLLGGQDVKRHLVTHEIMSVKLFKDPSKNGGKILSGKGHFAPTFHYDLPEQMFVTIS